MYFSAIATFPDADTLVCNIINMWYNQNEDVIQILRQPLTMQDEIQSSSLPKNSSNDTTPSLVVQPSHAKLVSKQLSKPSTSIKSILKRGSPTTTAK